MHNINYILDHINDISSASADLFEHLDKTKQFWRALRAQAKLAKRWHQIYVQAGFTSDEAIKLVVKQISDLKITL